MRVKVKDLTPLHDPQVSGQRQWLHRLSDEDLLEACHNPSNGDRLLISSQTGKLVDGNGRAYELKSRAQAGSAVITPDTEIECEQYSPDNSMFPDVE